MLKTQNSISKMKNTKFFQFTKSKIEKMYFSLYNIFLFLLFIVNNGNMWARRNNKKIQDY